MKSQALKIWDRIDLAQSPKMRVECPLEKEELEFETDLNLSESNRTIQKIEFNEKNFEWTSKGSNIFYCVPTFKRIVHGVAEQKMVW